MNQHALADLPGRLRAWADRPQRWRPLVRHDPAERTFALLHRDEQLEIYVVCWMDGHDTGFHDHEESAASILVLEGAVLEERLALGRTLSATLTPGATIEVAREAIHRVRHAGDAPAVTLHAYSPPLARVGTYEFAQDGALLRRARAAEVPLRAAA